MDSLERTTECGVEVDAFTYVLNWSRLGALSHRGAPGGTAGHTRAHPVDRAARIFLRALTAGEFVLYKILSSSDYQNVLTY